MAVILRGPQSPWEALIPHISTGLQELSRGLEQRQRESKLGQTFKAAGLPEMLGPAILALPERAQAAVFNELAPLMAEEFTRQRTQPSSSAIDSEQYSPREAMPQGQESDIFEAMGLTPNAALSNQFRGFQPEEPQLPGQLTPAQQFGQAVLGAAKGKQGQPITARPEIPFKPTITQQAMMETPRPAGPMTRSQRASYKEALKSKKEELKEQRIEQKDIEKTNKPYVDEVTKGYRGAVDFIEPRIERQKALVQKGKLPMGVVHSFLESLAHPISSSLIDVHLPDLTSLEGADAAEFQKITEEYMKGIKDFFGARILEIEVKNYLKTLPTLSQTDEGKWRVLNNMKAFADAAKVKYQVMNDIIAENKGNQPKNLEELAHKRAKPQLQQIYDKFIKGEYAQPLKYEDQSTLAKYGRALIPFHPDWPSSVDVD